MILQKFELPKDEIGSIILPWSEGELLPNPLERVIVENHKAYIYAAVDPYATGTVELSILTFSEGDKVPVNYDEWNYIDSYQDGPIVRHVFGVYGEGQFDLD